MYVQRDEQEASFHQQCGAWGIGFTMTTTSASGNKNEYVLGLAYIIN
jgi:hypothetical protein